MVPDLLSYCCDMRIPYASPSGLERGALENGALGRLDYSSLISFWFHQNSLNRRFIFQY